MLFVYVLCCMLYFYGYCMGVEPKTNFPLCGTIKLILIVIVVATVPVTLYYKVNVTTVL